MQSRERDVFQRRVITVAVLTALGAILLQLLYRARYQFGPIDDAYIHMRVARNFANGFGPVFNVGDRVEATSSPMWTLLLGALLRIGINDYHAVLALEFLTTAGTAIATALLGYLAGGIVAAVAAPLLVAVLPSFAVWAGSGMETPLAFCALAVTVFAVLSVRSVRGAVLAGMLSGQLVWVRPEMMALVLTLGAAAVYPLPRDARSRAFIGFGVAWVVPVMMLFTARHAYFHEWLPNTYYAKVAEGGIVQRIRGLHYVSIFVVQHVLLVLLAAYAAVRKKGVVRWLGVIALNLALSIVWSGGDGFTFSRLTLPALLLVCVMVASLLEGVPLERQVLAGGAVTLLSVAWPLKGSGEFSSYMAGAAYAQSAERIAALMSQMPKGMVATEGIGAIGYITERPILDLVGLADKHIARSKRIPGARIGHDHADVPYVLSRAPEIVLPLVWMQDEPLDDATEIARLEAHRESWASALALVQNPTFRARYVPCDYETERHHLRVWLRSDVAGEVASAAPSL
jgi:hypothetical protein